jgi:hypothetical protein
MSDKRSRPWAICDQRQTNALHCWRRRVLWLARRFIVALLAIFSLAGLSQAQSQSATQPPAPQPQLQPLPRKTTAVSVAEAARNAKSKVDGSAPEKVFTNDDAAALPPGGISVVGPPPAASGAAKSKAKPADDTAKLAAAWKARFTAARQKLAQDKKELPALQTQLNVESLQELVMDPDTGQVYSDEYMRLLHQIDATKLAIQNDKQALTDSHDEFRHAGGLPGWIR